MTSDEKAALLLNSLGPEVAETVLTGLAPSTGNRVRSRLQAISQAPAASTALDEVLEEFYGLLEAIDTQIAGKESPRPAALRGVSTNEAAAPTAAKDAAPPVVDDGQDPLPHLQAVPAERLALALDGEQPRTVVLLLNALGTEHGGEVLKRLPQALRREVSLLLGEHSEVPAPVLQRIARAVLRKSLALPENPPDTSDTARYKKVADMLRLLPRVERLEIIASLGERDPATAEGVKGFLYQFEDLLLIEDRSMQRLLSEVDSKVLATAIKGAPADINDRVLNNLSKRARESLNEEMEFLGTLPAAEVDKARKSIIELIQRLDQAGELVMKE